MPNVLRLFVPIVIIEKWNPLSFATVLFMKQESQINRGQQWDKKWAIQRIIDSLWCRNKAWHAWIRLLFSGCIEGLFL